jgi:hypothetical protein
MLPRAGIYVGAIGALSAIVSTALYHPHYLSYYSPLVGGLRKASAYFEPTYFWDGLTAEARTWLNENTPPDRTVLFCNYTPSFHYMHQWGLLKAKPFHPKEAPLAPKWFVLQHRTGMMTEAQRRMVAEATPAFTVKRGQVTLLSIYPIEAHDRMLREGVGK